MESSSVPAVSIAPAGTYKYVLLRLNAGATRRVIVRGGLRPSGGDGFHIDIVEDTVAELKRAGLSASVECLGGGRIRREASSILLYGYSVAFGRADHEEAARLVRAAFPSCAVSTSNEGY